MPQPSIGRIVLYQRHGSPNGQHKAEPSPAIITAVRLDLPDFDRVDLCVINPNGIYFDKGTCHDEDGAPGTWRWPPLVPIK